MLRKLAKWLDWRVLAVTFVLTLLLAPIVLGQTVVPPPDQIGSEAWWAWLITGVSGVAISLLTQLFRKLLPNIPRVVVWALPLTLGGLAAALAQAANAADVTTLQGVLLGTAAIAARELVTTLKEHGVNG